MIELEKRIRGLFLEIGGIIAFIIISLLVWNNFDYENEAQIAYAYSNYNNMINAVITKNINALFPTDDESAQYIEGIKFNISNPNNASKTYNLFFKYDMQSSSLPAMYLKLNYEGNVYKLTDLPSIVKEDTVLYLIDTSKISKKDTIKKELKLYLDENTPTKEQDKLLSFSIYSEEK